MSFAVQAVATSGSITPTDINLTKILGNPISVNNGTSDSGTQRVVIASDNTPFSINAIQSGTWNIGTLATITNPVTVNQGTNPWIISGTVTANQGGTWTATVTQTTATNLNATVVGTGTFTVQAQQSGTWTNIVTQATASNLNATVIGTGTFAVQATQAGTWSTGRTWTLSNSTDSISAIQSGTWNINNISGTISLPTGAATSTNQINASQKTQIVDGSGNVIASTSNALNVNVNNTVPISGTIIVNQGTSPWVVSGTVAATQSGTWNIGTLTTITNPVTVSQGTAANLNATVVGTGTFLVQAAQSGSWSVTANAGTNLNTSALALDATLAKLTLTQGSTTSGETGPLIQGAVTTSAPSYTTAQTSPLSLTTSGGLRVDGSGTTQPISAVSLPLPTGASTFALQTTGNTSLNSIDTKTPSLGQGLKSASVPVTIASDQTPNPDSAPATQNLTTQDTNSTSTTFANGQVFVTGTPTAGSAANFAVAPFSALAVQVTGTWTGTLVTEISMDGGTTWFTRGVKQSGTSYITSTFTANFSGDLNYSGMTNFRVRSTAALPGTATVKIVASSNVGSIIVSNPQLLRDATTQSITNTIKAASTAAVSTDTSLVVALNPNTPLNLVNSTATGMTRFRNTALSNTAVAVKASAGNLYSYHVYNSGSTDAFLQFYNVAQGSVTVGTTTPDLTYAIPAGGVLDGTFSSAPFSFSTAITIAATSTITGGTAPGTALLVNLGYA